MDSMDKKGIRYVDTEEVDHPFPGTEDLVDPGREKVTFFKAKYNRSSKYWLK